MSEFSVPDEFVQALHELGVTNSATLVGEPLTGGVSSDIWRIDTEQGPVCAKRALAKLRVAADWQAPIERNSYEARWLQIANQASPGCAPELLGQHPGLGVLVMRYLPPSDFRLWKQVLRAGQADLPTARSVAQVLARIHSYSAKRPDLAQQFQTDRIFFDIRLEPYLLATAQRHPDLADALQTLVLQTQSHAKALVHGDVSPKNILLSKAGPVFLDAECAWWGDPAFDLAFCLNHLLLKCLWTPSARPDFLACFDALSSSYLQAVDWEPSDELEKRAAHLLPGLLLARVDGKSPVEYITREEERHQVRRVARALISQPVSELNQVAQAWDKELTK